MPYGVAAAAAGTALSAYAASRSGSAASDAADAQREATERSAQIQERILDQGDEGAAALRDAYTTIMGARTPSDPKLVDDEMARFFDIFSSNTDRTLSDLYADQRLDARRRGRSAAPTASRPRRRWPTRPASCATRTTCRRWDAAIAKIKAYQGLAVGEQGVTGGELNLIDKSIGDPFRFSQGASGTTGQLAGGLVSPLKKQACQRPAPTQRAIDGCATAISRPSSARTPRPSSGTLRRSR
jgi:hypothetical protein